MVVLRSQSKVVGNFVFCDYIEILPPEILSYILNMLDLDDISNCLLVSTSWNHLIRCCSLRWRSACKTIGASNSSLTCSDIGTALGQYHYFELCKKLSQLNNKAAVKLNTIHQSDIDISNTYLHNDVLGVAYVDATLSFMDINTQKVCSKMKLLFSATECLWFNGVKLIYADKDTIVVNTSTAIAEHHYKYDTKHAYNGAPAIRVEFVENMDLFISLHSANFNTVVRRNQLKVWSTREPYVLLHDIDIGVNKSYGTSMAHYQYTTRACTIITDSDDYYSVIKLTQTGSDDNTITCATIATINVADLGFCPTEGGGSFKFDANGSFIVAHFIDLRDYGVIQVCNIKCSFKECECSKKLELRDYGCFRKVDEVVLEPTKAFVVHFVFRDYLLFLCEFYGIGKKYVCVAISIEQQVTCNSDVPDSILCFIPIYDKAVPVISLPYFVYSNPHPHKNILNILDGLDQSFNNSVIFISKDRPGKIDVGTLVTSDQPMQRFGEVDVIMSVGDSWRRDFY